MLGTLVLQLSACARYQRYRPSPLPESMEAIVFDARRLGDPVLARTATLATQLRLESTAWQAVVDARASVLTAFGADVDLADGRAEQAQLRTVLSLLRVRYWERQIARPDLVLASTTPDAVSGDPPGKRKSASTSAVTLASSIAALETSSRESFFHWTIWKLVGADTTETGTSPAHWGSHDWLIAGGATAGIGLTTIYDRDIQTTVQRNRNRTVNHVCNPAEALGAEYSFGVLGAFYIRGEVLKDLRATAGALDGLSASIIAAGLMNTPLKYAVGRRRPRKDQGGYHFAPVSGNDSFPSGHTTQAFALATVIAEQRPSPWVKFGSYDGASKVGDARLNNKTHSAADVLAAAAIGTFVGHEVVHVNQNHRTISMQPGGGPNRGSARISFTL